jgi:hypothetical protein
VPALVQALWARRPGQVLPVIPAVAPAVGFPAATAGFPTPTLGEAR